MYQTIDCCRSCGGSQLTEILSLGNLPLADGLLASAAEMQQELRFPLNVVFCRNCSLVQLKETVAPDVLFGNDYPYYSSFSTGWMEHCRANALELIQTRQLNGSSHVIEIASNDGYMLRNFHEQGIPVLGIDPVPGPASAAEQIGIPTLREFFSLALAESMTATDQRADVILANNVLAHVADLDGFVHGLRTILKPDGVIVIEVPYVRDLMEHTEFDTIYHEHLCYFSGASICRLFNDRQLAIREIRQLPTHGGSLRIYAAHGTSNSEQVDRFLQDEQSGGLHESDCYGAFADNVGRIQAELRQLLAHLHEEGSTVAAYGAAAKGTTLLNASGVLPEHLQFVVDRNIHKHGRYMPGLHTPISAPSRLLEDMPDYVLLLAWNYKDEVMSQQEEYVRRGGRFIIPIPELVITENVAV